MTSFVAPRLATLPQTTVAPAAPAKGVSAPPAWAGLSDAALVAFFEANEATASRIPALAEAAEAAYDRIETTKAAREERITRSAAKAAKLVASFEAHREVGNVGGMESALRGLRQATIQAGLIRHLGGVEGRDAFHEKAAEEIRLLRSMKKAATARPHKSKAARAASDAAYRASMRGSNAQPPKFGSGKRSKRAASDPNRQGK